MTGKFHTGKISVDIRIKILCLRMSVNFCWHFPHLLLGKTICVRCGNSLKHLSCPSREDAKIHMYSACLVLIHYSIQPKLTLFYSFFYTFGCLYFIRWSCVNKSCIMYQMRFRKVCSGHTGHKFKMLSWTYCNFFPCLKYQTCILPALQSNCFCLHIVLFIFSVWEVDYWRWLSLFGWHISCWR
jgi:hypothetical protein